MSVSQARITHPNRSPVAQLLSLLAWCTSKPHAYDLAIILLLSAPVPLIMALSRDVIVNYTHHDIFVPLDAAWRALQGQWPHTDVYSPLGLAYFWQHGLAAWLWGMDGKVVIRANLIALPVVILPALLLAWRRLNAIFTILLIVLLTVLVVAPTFLDGPQRAIAELANYNRIGSAMCAVVCLWALCLPRERRRLTGVAETVVLGLVMLVLLYLKVTFFALASATVVVGCFTVERFWRGAVEAAAVAAAGVIGLELLHPGLLSGYLADLRRVGASSTQLFRGYYAPLAFVSNLGSCVLIGALAAAALWIAPRQWLEVAGIVVVAGGCVLVATQNFGAFSIPLIVLIMLLAQRLAAGASSDASIHVSSGAPALQPILEAVGVVATVMVAAPFLFTQVGGTVYSAMMSRSEGVALGSGRSDTLRDVVWSPNKVEKEFVPDNFTMEEAAKWRNPPLPAALAAAILADGIALLQDQGLAQRRIANLSFSNPFPVALRAPSPRGVALWWDEDRTFTVGTLTPDMILGDAEVAMVPKLWWENKIISDLLGVARPKLQQDFTPHESRYWTAWVKK